MKKIPEFLGSFLAVLFIVALMGFLSYWFHWDDDGRDDFIDYRIERSRPEAKFVKV